MSRGQSGQSLVEVVALAPVVLLCGLLGMQALAAGATYLYADNAAHSGALAAELGENANSAARRALPRWAAGAVDVKRSSGAVRVTVAPRSVFPGLDRLLRVRSSASFVAATGG